MLNFLTGEELSVPEFNTLLDKAVELKKAPLANTLENKTLALIFEKPSLRTRVSFTVAIQELGGQVIELTTNMTKKEDPEDSIRVLQGYVKGVMVRTFSHEVLERMVPFAKIPIINGLSDSHHPCQILADLLTLKENFGRLKGLKLAYIGDGNNVLNSLLLLAPFMGVDIHYSCPQDFTPDPAILARAHDRARRGEAKISAFSDPRSAVVGVDAIYTDVWTSMGFEKEENSRLDAFKGYQLNTDLLNLAAEHALIMHCMPVHKGQEITNEMVNHQRSVLFQQSENRLHAQKALLVRLFTQGDLA